MFLGHYEFLWLPRALAILTYLVADRFTIVGLGRDASISLGLNYTRVFIAGLLIVSVTTALTTVTVGMIPFVGVVVPNVVSRLAGDNLRATLPWVAAPAAGLAPACDILGRIRPPPLRDPRRHRLRCRRRRDVPMAARRPPGPRA